LNPGTPGFRFDAAVDFVDMAAVLDRMQAAFFSRRD
jgi:hypothetical protein